MLHLYLTGNKLSTDEAFEYLDGETGGTAKEGATFGEAIKALRRLGCKFRARTVHKLKTTRSLKKKMLLVCDEESYVEPHAVLLYREGGIIWLFDCLKIGGAHEITEEAALRLIKRSDETF